jgi:hypothetical protein
MANNLWTGAIRSGLAAAMPTVPDFPSETFGLYYATDTGLLFFGASGAAAWSLCADMFNTQGAPTAETTTSVTLTIAKLLTRIITSTQTGAVAFTLPTGTLTDAGFGNGALPVGASFDWAIVNLGSSSGAVTVGAGTGHTVVGNMVVAISTTGQFRTRKTAANTYVTYRIA